MTKIPTTEQLRARIDSGATGEKVSSFDPAAAPLGTDDEAAGNPPSVEERQMEANAQPRVRPNHTLNGPLLYLAIIMLIATAVMVIKVFV